MIYLSALGIRLLPSIYLGLPYGYDFWEEFGRITSMVRSGHFLGIPPQGPMFYLLLVGVHLLLEVPVLEIFTYFVPFASSAVILFVYLFTYKISNQNSALLAALMAATAGIFVHQTTLPVPESLGLTFLALVIYLLYDVMTKGGFRRFFLLFLASLAVILTHHLTTFFLLLTLALLCPVMFVSKGRNLRTSAPLILFSALLLFTLIWWLGGVPVVPMFFESIFEASAGSWVFGASLAALCLFLGYRVLFGWGKLGAYLSGKEIKISAIITLTFTAGFAIAIFALLPRVIQYRLSLLYQIYYILPYALVLLFPGLAGLFVYYSRATETWKRFYPIVWIVAPLASACFLIASSNWGSLSYRHLAFIFLGGFPMVGCGYYFLCKAGDVKLRFTKGVLIAYAALLIGLLSFPPPQLLVGLNEAYYFPEVHAATWAPKHIPPPTTFDSDHRMGVVLRFTTGQRVCLGNETSWLGEVSQTGFITPINQTIKHIVITDSMLKDSVVGGFLKESNPLPQAATDYLNHNASIYRIYNSGVVTIYQTS